MIGSMLGHYRILEKIGEGGMGIVYRAQDTNLERDVALKFLPSDVALDPERLQRFRREAKTVAQLNHPNIVTVYSVENDRQDGGERVHYFSMELVDGHSLDALIPDEGLPLEQLFSLGMQLTEAISAAHDRGCVHRDLKPANVMVDRDQRLKILDFGIAKLFDSSEDERLSRLSTMDLPEKSGVAGTVPYMSPEQLDAREVDPRSDIFSVGVILYEMATGRRPFAGLSVRRAIREEDPEPVDEVRPAVPGEVARLIESCMAKSPEARPADGDRLRSRLAELRERWRAAALAPPEHSLAVLPFRMLTERTDLAYFGEGLAEELIRALSPVDALRVAGARSTANLVATEEQDPKKDLDPKRIARILKVAHFLDGSVRDEGSHLRVTAHLCEAETGYELWGESFDHEWGEVFEIQDRISRAIVEGLRLRLLPEERDALFSRQDQDPEAHSLYLRGRYFWNKRYEGGLESAISFFSQAIAKAPGSAMAYAGLADCFNTLGWYAIWRPADAFTKAKDAAGTAVRLAPHRGESHCSLAAVLHLYDWDWARAGEHFATSVELNPNYAYGRWLYSYYLMTRGDRERSLEQARAAIELDPINPAIVSTAGWMHYLAGDQVKAEAILEDARRLESGFGITNIFLAWLYEQKQEWELALAAWDRADEAWRDPATGQVLPSLRLQRCYSLTSAGRESEALELFREVNAVEEQGAYIAPAQKAIVQAVLGEHEMALDSLEEALSLRDCWLLTLRADPRWRAQPGLQDDPRFKNVVEAIFGKKHEERPSHRTGSH